MPPIRILIVDDHTIVRKGLRALLGQQPEMDVVGEAGNGEEALAQAKALKPDVILMDLVMPKMDGIEATRQITARLPHTRILVLTSFASDDKVFPAIQAGALGYLLKETKSADLTRAIEQVYRGEPSMDPAIAQRVLYELGRPSEKPPTPDPLTQRELEVLKLVAQGLGNQEIAERLVITEITVRSHVSNILAKLHLANRVQATLYALREGLVSLEAGDGSETG
jgi:two-component system, NarL family, response regulator LiaR